MKAFERERRDWVIIALILLLGFLCVFVAGQQALRFSPRWQLHANMESNLDPNSDFLTRRPSGFIEPVDPSILTQPVWINLFLTPGAQFVTGTLIPNTDINSVATSTPTQIFIKTSTPTTMITLTPIVTVSPTSTFVYHPATSTPPTNPTAFPTGTPTPTSTPVPGGSSTATSIPSSTASSTPTSTSTPTPTGTSISTSTPTNTPTNTPTSTSTSTATPTPTNTPAGSEPDFGNPDGNAINLGSGASFTFNVSGLALDGNSSWDAVYYEMEEISSAGKIHLGAVQIEIYDQTTSAWYMVYNWGDGVPDTNASYNNGNSEPDGFPVDKTLLYGVAPLNTGIAIDIDTPALGQGGSVGDVITKIRIISLSNTKCDIDALQMLR